MAFIAVVINVVALMVGGSHPVTIVSLIAGIWAWGIASNFKRPYEPHLIPTYAMYMFIASLITGVVMLIIGAAT